MSAGLTRRYVAGAKGRRHKAVDYEGLLNKAKDHRKIACDQLHHMEKLTNQNKERKEADLLRLHKEVWRKEMQKLQQERRKIEMELELWKTSSEHSGIGHDSDIPGEMWVELAEVEIEIVSRKEHFNKQYLLPVRRLLGKIKAWKSNIHKAESEQGGVSSREGLREELVEMREELKCLWLALEDEYVSLSGQVAAVEKSMKKVGRQEGGVKDREGEMIWEIERREVSKEK